MSLVVTTAAEKTEKRIVKLDDVKSRLGISVSSQDALLTSFIDEASQLICDYLDRPLAAQTYTETIPGSGRTTLLLKMCPIVSVTSVTYEGTAYTDYSIADSEAGILYRQSGWYVAAASESDLVHDPHPGYESPDWVIVYKAGYTMPASANPPETGEVYLPASFSFYAMQLIEFLYRNSGSTNPRVSRRAAEGLEEEYFAPADQVGVSGMPVSLENALSRWKRY